MKKYHRLLTRQLKKVELGSCKEEEWNLFLKMVNDAYLAFDADLAQLEKTLEMSSKELFEANQRLKSNVEEVSSRLSRVARNIREVIFEMDISGNWTYLNTAWERMTGIKISEALDTPYHIHFKDCKGQHLGDFLGLMKSFPAKHHKTIQVRLADRNDKWLDFSVTAVKGKDGQRLGYTGAIVDITDLKETERALIRAKEKETKANKAKDEFLSTMSHEIRTPLNAVIGISNLLAIEDPKMEQLENLSALKDSSEHLLELVNDILDFNKISSGSIDLEQRSFSFREICRKLENIFSQKVIEKGIIFDFEIDEALPDFLIGDSTRISQIMANLIGNAIKFTEFGGVFISISVLHQNENECEMEIEVRDTGIGIERDKMNLIFSPFEQANRETTRIYGGTGLGLAICNKLLEFMDSNLSVSSELEKGSRFAFMLKLKKDKKLVMPSGEKGPQSNSRQGLKGARILVVEDNKVNTMVIQKFLQKWEVQFDMAENGKIAEEMAHLNVYDMILMDLQMPIMNGYEATKIIRSSLESLNREVPIFALSASTRIESKEGIYESGMNGLITKPFNPDELQQTLSAILFNHNTNNQKFA